MPGLEVHYGFDKRYYVVDAARLCPPEALPKLEPGQVRKQGQHLWRFLRPEVVKNNTEPLSSDSFRFDSLPLPLCSHSKFLSTIRVVWAYFSYDVGTKMYEPRELSTSPPFCIC